MYNRYVPQEDGTYSRRQVSEQPEAPAVLPSVSEKKRGLDTEDFLVMALLLLMGSEEKKSHSPLTLLLYLFL